MKRIVTAILILFALDSMCVDMNRVSFERDVSSIRSHSPTPAVDYAVPAYIPQHYDHTDEFHNESVLCFKLRRWVFQPVSVIFQVTAAGLFVGGQCCIDKYPETAKILNGVGIGMSVGAFVINTLLMRIDNKLEEMDRYIMQRRDAQDRLEHRAIPAIIQR